MQAFADHESGVRYYSRKFPEVFVTAEGSRIAGRSGRQYIDFFSGAGTLNYGHNDPGMKARLVAYVESNGITHSLDFATEAKEAFILGFQETILRPRGLAYRMLFPAPTGTNAVEAALKTARKATGRSKVVSFAHAFHGMTAGSMAVSGGPLRPATAVPVGDTFFLPYDGTPSCDGPAWLEALLAEAKSDAQVPAACIVETIQAEGGVVTAGFPWLKRLADICKRHGILLIVDDIQTGCGRTGSFFSFEPAGIRPDIVCLSKSLSGMGLPLSLVLVRKDCDRLSPGEHNGTFRGNNLAFITAVEAFRFWRDDRFEREVERKGLRLHERLVRMAEAHAGSAETTVRGRGMLRGIALTSGDLAGRVSSAAFERGLVIETAGPRGEVLKCLPPLVISDSDLDAGLDILAAAMAATVP
ncbi:MAG: Diaminobutyrate-2-oxoglutarate transaminase [Proteobacteria bacterium]|nr:Diaminobutyrate-2-oxoglutarate transaminase [Pseudomonadota bacterium]